MPHSERKPVHTGGCQCGAVRFALYAPPENVHLCHCRMCQKAVGGPFIALAPVRRADFAWTRGTPGCFASSSLARRDFCRDCGTPLSFYYVDSEHVCPTIGSFDRPQEVAPVRLYGIESRMQWIDGVSTLPGEAMDAVMPEGRKRSIVNYQHPDQETASWSPHRPQPG
jgi:hypothetical protein